MLGFLWFFLDKQTSVQYVTDCRNEWKPQQKDEAPEVNYNYKPCQSMASKRISIPALTKTVWIPWSIIRAINLTLTVQF